MCSIGHLQFSSTHLNTGTGVSFCFLGTIWYFPKVVLVYGSARCGGFMVNVLDSGSSGLGSSPS